MTGKPKKRPTDKPTRIQEVNRGVILDAALEMFSNYGFRGTTIDQITEKAGISKPSLLYYFKRNDVIYAAVPEATMDDGFSLCWRSTRTATLSRG